MTKLNLAGFVAIIYVGYKYMKKQTGYKPSQKISYLQPGASISPNVDSEGDQIICHEPGTMITMQYTPGIKHMWKPDC